MRDGLGKILRSIVRTVLPGGRHRRPTPQRTRYVWSIGVYEGSSPFDLRPPHGLRNPVLTWRNVSDVKAAFVADPFMTRVGSLWYMFFEVMSWTTGRGEIGLAVSSDARTWRYERSVLREPFHLSYPYVFEWGGEHYMVPESHQAGEVRLYRAVRFPTEWSCVGPLLERPYLADASIVRHDDRWWLFVDTSKDLRHDTLSLYHAAELEGPWHEHPLSPIVQGDPHVARPAGRMLRLDERVIRYTQDCDPRYGLGVRAFEVTELTTTAYRERLIGDAPILRGSGHGWNADGMHHVDAHRLADERWLACVDGWVSVGTDAAAERIDG